LRAALLKYLVSFTGFGRNARLFLVTTIIYAASFSLFMADFNLYLESVGVRPDTIGVMMAVSQLTGVVVAFPFGALSNRIGRRAVMAGGMGLVALALVAALPGNVALIFLSMVAVGAGSQAVAVVQIPYIAEQTEPEQRNEYFAVWSAVSNATYLGAILVGGLVAAGLAPVLGMSGGAGPYRVLLVGTTVLALLALASTAMLSSDRPVAREASAAKGAGARFGIVVSDWGLFVRLLLPGFITSIGAGQLILFLNIFIQEKFNLELPAINAIQAIGSLGTTLAILAQPFLARRFGRISSIVLVQSASIPFLLVLGFSPYLATVVVAYAVRNSLMNAGSPLFDAFAMERVPVEERATISAAMTLLWSLGWTIGPLYYSALQQNLGFSGGYAMDFITIIVLYTIATAMLWIWFHKDDKRAPEYAVAREAAVEVVAHGAAGGAVEATTGLAAAEGSVLEHA
jgi:MFS family permease